jgi:hypothetical protein
MVVVIAITAATLAYMLMKHKEGSNVISQNEPTVAPLPTRDFNMPKADFNMPKESWEKSDNKNILSSAIREQLDKLDPNPVVDQKAKLDFQGLEIVVGSNKTIQVHKGTFPNLDKGSVPGKDMLEEMIKKYVYHLKPNPKQQNQNQKNGVVQADTGLNNKGDKLSTLIERVIQLMEQSKATAINTESIMGNNKHLKSIFEKVQHGGQSSFYSLDSLLQRLLDLEQPKTLDLKNKNLDLEQPKTLDLKNKNKNKNNHMLPENSGPRKDNSKLHSLISNLLIQMKSQADIKAADNSLTPAELITDKNKLETLITTTLDDRLGAPPHRGDVHHLCS